LGSLNEDFGVLDFFRGEKLGGFFIEGWAHLELRGWIFEGSGRLRSNLFLHRVEKLLKG
jgi:hypothetical protein